MFSYATPSVFRSEPQRATLGLSCDRGRPIRFEGRLLRDVPLVRFALRALGELIWSSASELRVLDPIVTAHPDALVLEAFSSDMSCYGRVDLDMSLFQVEGSALWGTTNVDFSTWLWSALGELRSHRQTWFRLGASGFEVETLGAGGQFQPRVEVPETWYRGFLEVQAALLQPGIRLQLNPVDLLAPIRFLRHKKARISPRAMRFIGEEGHWRIVLEPWEAEFPLSPQPLASSGNVRCWGRQRLRFLEPLLPFARGAQVLLKGRGRPHFYQVDLGSVQFFLGLTGWGGLGFSEDSGHSWLVGLARAVDERRLAERLEALQKGHLQALDPDWSEVDNQLVRRGLAMVEPDGRQLRYRPLSAEPLNLEALYPLSPQAELAASLRVEGLTCVAVETRKIRRLRSPEGRDEQRELVFRDWSITGDCWGEHEAVSGVQLTVSDRDRMLFGRCPCAFFQEHLLNRGPCAHLLALFEASRELRVDGPSSRTLAEEDEPAGGEGEERDD